MITEKDYFQKPNIPKYILCKANKERIGKGTIKCTSKTYDEKYKDLDEITFTTYMNIDNKKNPLYDEVDIMKYVLLPNVGFFSISSVNIQSEGTEFEYKEVIAKSYECLLAQKYLETFTINMGTVESIDGVQFYNIGDKEHSLLHLVLSLCPEWEIGHIDIALCSKQRSFQIDRQDMYSFLMNDVAGAFECVFLFDTLNNTINVYEEKNVGADTNIHISYNNLLKKTNISCDMDNIKTCLAVTGSDDLTLREINMGFDKIYCLTPYLSTDYMSKGLYHACTKWIGIRNSYENQYTTLLSQYQNYIKQINFLTHEKMPSNPNSTDWTQYGLNPLKEKLAAYEQKQAVSMKAGHGGTSSNYYRSEYLPIYNTINAINTQITKVNAQLNTLISSRDNAGKQMSKIMDIVSMQNNFTSEQLQELNSFIREDELSSDNFVVTDTMTDEEKFEMLNDVLMYANEELYKVAIPQLAFSVGMVDIFNIPEYSELYGQFKTGNYIWVSLRDDYYVKPRLLTIHTDFYNPTNFSVTFGNISKKSKNKAVDVGELMREAKSAATSVSFNASYWNASAKKTSDIGKMLNEGLLSAGKYLSSGDDSEMVIDSRGIFVNTTTGDYAYKDSIFIGGGRILFTDDGWKSVAMSVDCAIINGESRFGTFADFCIASYIAGSTIVGGTITGTRFNNGNGTFLVDEKGNLTANSANIKGNITASKISGSEITGTSINNGNGTFSVDKNGKLLASSATIKGDIKADTGYIGGSNGFTITSGKLYSGKSSLSSINNGVYIGNDGIALGNKFKVDKYGKLIATDVELTGKITANSGTIGGANIHGDSISSSNGNWAIYSNGYATFKNVVVAAQSGSTFGGITYNSSGTYGNFSNGFKASNSFGLTGNAKTDFDNLVVGNITADNVFATGVFTNYLDAKSIKADYMEVKNWTSDGLIQASKIDVDDLFSGSIIVKGSLGISSIASFSFDNVDVEWGYINGVKCLVAAE